MNRAERIRRDPRPSPAVARDHGISASYVRYIRLGKRMTGPAPTLPDSVVLAIRSDPRPAPEVADDLGMSPKSIQAIRRGGRYAKGPWPKVLPSWPKGTPGHAHNRPGRAGASLRKVYARFAGMVGS